MAVPKGERDRTWCCMCSKAHCNSITDSPAVSGAGGVGAGVMDVPSPETGTTEDGVADGVQGRERKQNKTAFFLVTQLYFRLTENGTSI